MGSLYTIFATCCEFSYFIIQRVFLIAKYLNKHFNKENTHMANKHMKICAKLLTVKEMQMKITRKYHYTPIRIATIKILTIPSTTRYLCRMQSNWNSHYWLECKLVQPLWKQFDIFLNKVKCTFTIWPSNPTPRHFPREIKTYIHPKTCTWVFITTLFLRAKNWKQPNVLQQVNE